MKKIDCKFHPAGGLMRRVFYAGILIHLLSPVMVFGQGQLSSPVEEVTIQQYTDYDDLVLGQQAQSNLLVLTPDSCFFFPTGPGLTGEVESTIPGAYLNRDHTYSTVTNIRNVGQKIIWPMMPSSQGQVSVDVYLEADESLAGSDVIVRLGDMEQQVTVTQSDGLTPQPWSLTANISQAGVSAAAIQNLEVELVNLNGATEVGEIHKIEVQGTPLSTGYLLRARWRPAAVHSSFMSSGLTASGLNAQMWIMEVKPDYSQPDVLGFYAPITTKFGYYGSTFDPVPSTPEDDFTSGGINFSFWSFGSSGSKPPLLEHSHLLSLGNPVQTFDGFNHEGTGVKPRGFNPFEGQNMDTVVLAIRLEPAVESDPYHYKTYTSYYFDPVSRDWRLYASGKKYTSDLAGVGNYLNLPGSFIEVPGPPVSQRTGQVPRVAEFRGWVQDTTGNWHGIDEMKAKSVPTTTPYAKNWKSAGDGWLRMSMGGIIQQRYQSGNIVRQSVPGGLPDYMSAENLIPLATEPAGAEVNGVGLKSDGNLELDFTLTNVDADAEVKIYYGDEDALTLIYEEHGTLTDEWDQQQSIGNFSSGRYVFSIPSVRLPGIINAGYCRILVETSQGRYWSRETASWSSANLEDGFWVPAGPFSLATDTIVGTEVGGVSAFNPSQYPFVTYSILSGNEQGAFAIDPSTGIITVANNLPHVAATHKLMVQANTGGSSGESDVVMVYFDVHLAGSHWKIGDSFDQGSAGESLNSLNSGSGWSGAWSGDTVWALEAPGISFPGISSTGLKVKMGSQGSTISRYFNQTIEVGDGATQLQEAWVSCLIDMVGPVNAGHSVCLKLRSNGSEIGSLGKIPNGTLGFELGDSGWQDLSGSLGSRSKTEGTWLFVLHLQADGGGNIIASLNAGDTTEVGASPTLADLTHVASATISGPVQLDGVQLYRWNNEVSFVDEITISGHDPFMSPSSHEPPVVSNATFGLVENAIIGASVGVVSATDSDAGDTLDYVIVAGNTENAFTIDNSGNITTASSINYESTSAYVLTVAAIDSGGLSDAATVTVNVSNVNEAPSADDTSGSVAENLAAGTVVASVNASDPDEGDRLGYVITAGNDTGLFTVDANGQISTTGGLDYEALNQHILTVAILDDGAPPLSDTATVTVNVTDVVISDDSDADLLNDNWEILHYGSHSLITAAVDTDGDGMTSFQEMVFGSDPRVNDVNQNPVRQSIVDDAGIPKFEFKFRRPQNYATLNVIYTLQTSTDLVSGNWVDSELTPSITSDVSNEWLTYLLSLPSEAGASVFFRCNVTPAP